MITAVDSNVLIDILGADPTFGPQSRSAARQCLAQGRLVVCAAVWAEVVAAFPDVVATEDALGRLPVAFEPLDRRAARRAGLAWGAYRRRGGSRERVVAGFLIAAHALEQADRLLTRDRGFYRTGFEDLTILDPTA